MDKALPTEAAEDTGSGELAGKFHQQRAVCAKSTDVHIYFQME